MKKLFRSRIWEAVGVYPRPAAQSQVLSEHGALGERRRGRVPHRQERGSGQTVGSTQEQPAHDLRKAQSSHEVPKKKKLHQSVFI